MIKAIFPEGVTAMTVNGLHQWDYGQQLQIQASGLPALVEVHFACDGMKEAVVRSCAVTSDTLTAAIPDICLEQTSPVIAWVYIVGASSGITTLTVTLPIIARARPQPSESIPTEISDKYTEAVAAMNTVVNGLSAGNFTAARAISDSEGNNIPKTYAEKTKVNGASLNTDILAYAAQLATGGTVAVEQKTIGPEYETDAEGNPVNLPSKNCIPCRATIATFRGYIVIELVDHVQRTIYYNMRNAGIGWTGWVEVVTSKNIGNYMVKRAQYTPVALNITVTGSSDGAADLDLTYYQDGEKKTVTSGVSAGASRTFTISADMGSNLSLSNNYGVYVYEIDDLPLVEKSDASAAGSFAYKSRFIVIGGGTAAFRISGKG